jgi:methionyl-tRNA synthetase
VANSTYYITTAIPYVNAKPHLGHLLEWLQADALARYHRLLGEEVGFTSGADENSLKNVQAAEKAGKAPQDWLDEYAQIFKDAYQGFGIDLTGFGRGSDQKNHWPGVQKLWELCAHDMYTQEYEGLYCLGCEAFYTPDELIDGKCPEHLVAPEKIKETNYFFKLSKYQSQIRDLIASDKLHIISDQFKQETLGFIDQGLQDFSVSRSKERGRGIGVPVPGDETQVMYVWFDALAIYMTTLGWGTDEKKWQHFWNDNAQITHVIGKGIVRFHAIYWIGMLLSAGLPLPTTISVHGYITANGQKMSKSLGNVIDPFELVKQYPLETIRYYLLKYIPTHADGDFSFDKFREVYTADLANGLGNLCSRVAKLCEKTGLGLSEEEIETAQGWRIGVKQNLEAYEISKALEEIWQQDIAGLDQYLSEQKPWTKTGDEQRLILKQAAITIVGIAYNLQPFMPQTAQIIINHFGQTKIAALSPLFPRLPEVE